MMIVPVYNMVTLPDTNIYFPTERFEEIVGSMPKEDDEKATILILKEDISKEKFQAESFYSIALTGIVKEVSSEGYVLIYLQKRVNVDEICVDGEHNIALTLSKAPVKEDTDPEFEEERLKKLKAELEKFSSNFQWGKMAKNYIQHWNCLEEVLAGLSPWILLDASEKYALLEQESKLKRAELMERAVRDFIEVGTIKNRAENDQNKEYQDSYKEKAIRRQIEYLQKELDEMHPENISDVRELELKLSKLKLNDAAKKETQKVLKRLKQEGNNSPEYGLLYNYLDFVVGLPWAKKRYKKIDLDKAEGHLDAEHFGLKKVKDRIIQQVAVMNLTKKQSGSILLFVGAPGTGKTSIGQSIAKAMGREYVRVSLGGVRDEADIRGHRRTYIGAMAGRIMDGIKKSGVSNPVMVLDEVDKLSRSYNGDPASALLEVLDPEQNATFTDHYMNVPFDLSDVFFVCTANTLETIPRPLLNRMEVIRFSGYTATDKFEIAKKHLLKKAMEKTNITAKNMEVTDDAIRKIISDFTMEAGVRGLKKRLDTLCRAAAVKIARGNQEKLVIRPEDVQELLDAKPIRHDKALEEKKPGVVTGLAWTAAGGDILFIETLLTKGSGKIQVTGQLGDVMKESVQIAISLVKSMFLDKAEIFEKNDLHIHVPEGAVPKDGPSAGITLTTALSSLITDQAVSAKVAMTGEVTLRGVVTPIGGLPEKLMAAVRAGIETVFIPKDNEDDLKDVADEVKSQLKMIPVSEVKEVLLQTGVIIE